MNILVTGGAGFIGSWVVKRLLDDGHKVTSFDNLSNGSNGKYLRISRMTIILNLFTVILRMKRL